MRIRSFPGYVNVYGTRLFFLAYRREVVDELDGLLERIEIVSPVHSGSGGYPSRALIGHSSPITQLRRAVEDRCRD